MPAWALRIAAVLVTVLSMVGSTTYALAHPKNPNAPLQPPVADKSQVEPEPDPTPLPTLPFRTVEPTPVPTPSPSPTVARPSGTATGS
ncbi:MAG TPA: hypothetical protein VJQ09_02275, partial [Candidatus Limnocylindria bacterium]|nr:hypothetical protein [Candidatus Limnocylindria bacterium]